MSLYHNSQESYYRFPAGAVPTDEGMRIRLQVGRKLMPSRVMLRLWIDDHEVIIPMELERELAETSKDCLIYQAVFTVPNTPMLVWYYFVVEAGGQCTTMAIIRAV